MKVLSTENSLFRSIFERCFCSLELNRMLANSIITGGGVIPNIHAVLLPERPKERVDDNYVAGDSVKKSEDFAGFTFAAAAVPMAVRSETKTPHVSCFNSVCVQGAVCVRLLRRKRGSHAGSTKRFWR
jgi:hypothetical protein